MATAPSPSAIKRRCRLISRNNKSFNEKFYPVTAALEQLKMQAVFDGEIIISNKEGISSFGDLQNWRSEADGDLLYYVFDLLWYNGRRYTKFLYNNAENY